MNGLIPNTSASVCGPDGVGRLSDSNSARNDLSLITYRAKPVVAALMSGARVKRLADCPSKVKPARVNFVIFFVSLVFAIVLLLVILSFFIRGVLFFDPSQRINEQGAITMAQPCGSERNVFLYNTGQCWANTGIQVVRGDRVEVTASGAYYGRVADLYHCAKDNCVLPFDMVMPGLVRISCGLEDKHDLIADLKQALEAI